MFVLKKKFFQNMAFSKKVNYPKGSGTKLKGLLPKVGEMAASCRKNVDSYEAVDSPCWIVWVFLFHEGGIL